jgi:hypothetical protein
MILSSKKVIINRNKVFFVERDNDFEGIEQVSIPVWHLTAPFIM